MTGRELRAELSHRHAERQRSHPALSRRTKAGWLRREELLAMTGESGADFCRFVMASAAKPSSFVAAQQLDGFVAKGSSP